MFSRRFGLILILMIGAISARVEAQTPAEGMKVFEARRAEQELWKTKTVDEWLTMLDTADPATRSHRLGLWDSYADESPAFLRPVYLRSLDDPDLGVRLVVAHHILKQPDYSPEEQARAQQVYAQALDQPDPKYWHSAIYEITSRPEQLAPLLPRLTRLIGQIDDEQDWVYVQRAFQRLEGKGLPVADILIGFLDGQEDRAKTRAATLLRLIGPPARAALPSLLAILRTADDREVVLAANAAVVMIDIEALPRPSPAARFLAGEVATLNGPDMLAGTDAYLRLTQIGPDALSAMPAILGYFVRVENEPNMAGAWPIALSMHPLNFGDGLCPALIAQVRDDQPKLAHRATIFIGNGGTRYAAFIPAVTALLDRTHGEVKGAVAGILGSIGGEDPEIVTTLLRLAQDPDPAVRAGAWKGLRGHNHLTEATKNAAQKAQDDPDLDVRQAALGVLVKLDPLKYIGNDLSPPPAPSQPERSPSTDPKP